MFVDRFIRWGARIFPNSAWHTVPFAPILYLFLWGAVLRIVWDDSVPAPFEQTLTRPAETAWITLGLVSPVAALAAWWLIMRSTWKRSSLVGLWLRLAANVGMVTAVTSFHIADGLRSWRMGEDAADFYSRYIAAGVMVFLFLALLRDVWALVLTDRLAKQLEREGE